MKHFPLVFDILLLNLNPNKQKKALPSRSSVSHLFGAGVALGDNGLLPFPEACLLPFPEACIPARPVNKKS